MESLDYFTKTEEEKDGLILFKQTCYICNKTATQYKLFLDIVICEKCLPTIRKQLLGEK